MNVRTRVPSPSDTKLAEPARSAGELELATPMPSAKPQSVAVYAATVKAYPPKIAKALIKITRDIQPVVKAGKNDFHKYMYPKWEDVLTELAPRIADAGLLIIQSETFHGGFERDLIEISYDFTIINEDGDVWPDKPLWTAICKVRDQKGVIDDKAASKCHTQAHKYAMMQLFKIRVRDMGDEDHDNDGKSHQQKRPVPSPDGHVAPHWIKGVEGETAQTWAAKLLGFLAKAKTAEERQQWDDLNGKYIDMVQERDPNLYNKIVDALNPKGAEAAKPDPISSGIALAEASDFPGDKPLPTKDDGLEIPASLRRVPSPPKKPALSADERDWLAGLDGAFSGDEDMESLNDNYTRLLEPFVDRMSPTAVEAANALYNAACDRIGLN